MDRPLISLAEVHKRYANGLLALEAVSLQLEQGELVSLLGPSGCGKSTVLRLVAGLDQATSGQIKSPALMQTEGAAGANASTAFVFQDPTLMPWASVFDNVWLPLRLAGLSRGEAESKVRQQLDAVGLAEFAQAYPAELSGGMRMRASIARALVTDPALLLMDEPFAALDEFTRQKLNADLLAWWQQRRLSLLFVTHSVFEAVFLSQRVVVMGARPGRILADIPIDQAYPRDSSFRTSTRYAALCRQVTQALEAAHAPNVDAT